MPILRVVLIVFAFLCLCPNNAHSWAEDEQGTNEHIEAGMNTYSCACNIVLMRLQDKAKPERLCTATSDVEDNYEMRQTQGAEAEKYCTTITDTSTKITNFCLACGNPERSNTYGRNNSVAGDHAESPDKFETIDGRRLTVSIPHYLLLAEENFKHFHPHNLKEHDGYNREAQGLARKARDQNPAKRNAMFDRATYFGAFAQHFLEDAFSSGHGGFSRESSSNSGAKKYHDAVNTFGRTLYPQSSASLYKDGVEFFGDGHFRMLDNTATRWFYEVQVVSALMWLETFIFGSPHSTRAEWLEQNKPLYGTSVRIGGVFGTYYQWTCNAGALCNQEDESLAANTTAHSADHGDKAYVRHSLGAGYLGQVLWASDTPFTSAVRLDTSLGTTRALGAWRFVSRIALNVAPHWGIGGDLGISYPNIWNTNKWSVDIAGLTHYSNLRPGEAFTEEQYASLEVAPRVSYHFGLGTLFLDFQAGAGLMFKADDDMSFVFPTSFTVGLAWNLSGGGGGIFSGPPI